MAGDRDVTDSRVLVIGGGISGLAAAVELIDTTGARVELWEAGPRLGGKIASSHFAGVDNIDEGADAYLTRVPHAVAFAERVGVADLTSPTKASAAVWHRRLHDIPGGIVLGVPAAVRPFITTSLLSWRGKARAAIEPLLPRREADDSIGNLVRHRFGDEVHERLVDALVGSIYATDTDRSSLAAVPQLAALASSNRSLLLGARTARARAAAAPAGPIFAAPKQGMAALVEAAGRYLEARGATVRLNQPVEELAQVGGGWAANGENFSAVVSTAPAQVASRLLADASPTAAAGLASIEYADVTMVRLAVPADTWPSNLHGKSGYLVPKPVQRLVTAASFGSQKWEHWQAPSGEQILRVSLGRDGLPVGHLDDDEMLCHTIDELGKHLNFDVQPTAHTITRWVDAFPQYRPHHGSLVAEIERCLPAGFAIAGASYRGIGIPACIADGQRAARSVKESTDIADGFLT